MLEQASCIYTAGASSTATVCVLAAACALHLARGASTEKCLPVGRAVTCGAVKSPNLLVAEHMQVKVADFNLSRLLAGASLLSDVSSGGVTNPMWLVSGCRGLPVVARRAAGHAAATHVCPRRRPRCWRGGRPCQRAMFSALGLCCLSC